MTMKINRPLPSASSPDICLFTADIQDGLLVLTVRFSETEVDRRAFDLETLDLQGPGVEIVEAEGQFRISGPGVVWTASLGLSIGAYRLVLDGPMGTFVTDWKKVGAND